MNKKQGWRTDLDREMEGFFPSMPVIDQRSGTVTRPIQKKSRSLFDEMESMPEGNYQESYERRGGPRVGAEEMFQQMDRGMLSDPNSVVRQGEMIQNMPYNPDPGSVVRPEEMMQNMPYIHDPSEKVDPRDMIQLMQEGMLAGPPQDMPVPMLQATPDERRSLQERERRFYEEHPQSTLDLTPTEWTTPYNMPVYQDQHGQYHSESSSTGRIPDGRYMTHGMIWPDQESGKPRYFTEDEARDLIINNNFVNPVSQEEIPLFKTEDEAIQYAIDRDLILNDRKYPWNQ